MKRPAGLVVAEVFSALAMIALAALAFVALAGCPARDEIESADGLCGDGEPALAVDPSTGLCVQFASSCDVPVEWGPCPFPQLTACMVDEECALTQHCAEQPPDENAQSPTRICVDNAACDDTTDCGALETCEVGAAPPCDPMTTPMCPPPGLCAREPGSGPAPPAGCLGNFDCGPGQICPAQYGGCSEGLDPADGSACPSVCETACTADADCEALAMGFVCNAAEVCGEANGPSGMDTITCAGWCVPAR